jgi:cytochrome c peroxidase
MIDKKILLYATLIGAVILLLVAVAGTVAAQGPTLEPKEELGKSIFFDQNLSINQNQACAACHAPESGWTGPDEEINVHGAVYEGSVPGRFGDRKPPSSAYATQSPIFHRDKKGDFVGGNFWDGRATGEKLGNPAADQAQGPFLNPKEQALASSADVVERVCASGYADSFIQVWGESICDPANVDSAWDAIALSIAAYEASPAVNAFTSKYDYSLKGMAKLSKEEREGFALFQGKGQCKACHISSGMQPLFTDYTYDNLGIPQNPENPAGVAPDFVDPGLGGFLKKAGYSPDVYETEWGKFKVPTLRNVDKRPYEDFVKAFGHNGYFKSLEEIVHFYNTRDVLPVCDTISDPNPSVNCWPAPEVSENINRDELGDLGLTPDEEAAIVAFLKTLSDGYQP